MEGGNRVLADTGCAPSVRIPRNEDTEETGEARVSSVSFTFFTKTFPKSLCINGSSCLNSYLWHIVCFSLNRLIIKHIETL